MAMHKSPALEVVITDDGSATLRHPQHRENYHSKWGALTEAKSVFLENSGVADRLREHRDCRVLEIGFGTGFNFLLARQMASRHQSQLHYTGVEIQLPPATLAKQVLTVIDSGSATDRLLAILADCRNVNGSRHYSFDDNTELLLCHQDALTCEFAAASFDAIYLDAFSACHNEALWSEPFLKILCKTLADDGVLATYSVNRVFREALAAAGFHWQKRPGPPGKREVLIATVAGSAD